MRRPFRLALLVTLVWGSGWVNASEGGFSNFPWGAQTTYAAHMPASGKTAFFGYALYSGDSDVRDGNGNKLPGIKVEFAAVVPRVLHTWERSFFGWKMTSGVLAQGIYANVEAAGDEQHDIGPSLFGIEPLYFSRTFGAWTFFHGAMLYKTLGDYDRNRLANSTVGYSSFAYQVSVSWNPIPRLDVSLNAATEVKRKNRETGYLSAPQAGLTFGTSYKLFKDRSWDIGFSGFYTNGVGDDEIDGVRVPGGGRTEKFAIGPKLVYWLSPSAAVLVQWHREMANKNATKGNLIWFECTFPL